MEHADVAAHDVEINAFFHHGVVDVVVLLEEPVPQKVLPPGLFWERTIIYIYLYIYDIYLLDRELPPPRSAAPST